MTNALYIYMKWLQILKSGDKIYNIKIYYFVSLSFNESVFLELK